jgi:iron complex transport system substrate-binding protein
MFRRVGVLLGARTEAEDVIAGFDKTVAAISLRREGRHVPRVVLLEWFDPPFASGHWNPELIAFAGGREMIGRPGERSRRLTWNEVAAADPEVILLAPCGFPIERSEVELPRLMAREEWASLAAVRSRNVVVADGSAFFSRPGPRLEASLRIAAAAIDPKACGDLAPSGGWSRLESIP